MNEYGREEEIHFIRIELQPGDAWVNKTVAELDLPARVILSIIQRNDRPLIPRGDMMLKVRDTLVLGAESFLDKEQHIALKEIILKKNNPWIGKRIRDLNISRHSVVVLIKRHKKSLIPTDSFILRESDTIILYTQTHIDNILADMGF